MAFAAKTSGYRAICSHVQPNSPVKIGKLVQFGVVFKTAQRSRIAASNDAIPAEFEAGIPRAERCSLIENWRISMNVLYPNLPVISCMTCTLLDGGVDGGCSGNDGPGGGPCDGDCDS